MNARCLFLFEAPGGRAVRSGFISRNNPDETARTFLELNEYASLDRCLTVSWNIVPWYLSSDTKIRAAKRTDIDQGLPHLLSVDIIALSGRKAQRATNATKQTYPSMQIVKMWHPSPQSLNHVPSRREEILQVLRKIVRLIS